MFLEMDALSELLVTMKRRKEKGSKCMGRLTITLAEVMDTV